MNLQTTAKRARRAGTVQKLLGWFLTFFNGFFCLLGLIGVLIQNRPPDAMDISLVTFFAVMTVLGLIFIIRGRRNTRLARAMTRLDPPPAPIDLSASPAMTPPPPMTTPPAMTPSEPQPTAVQCPHCGAPNKLAAGAAGVCQYCGSPLRG